MLLKKNDLVKVTNPLLGLISFKDMSGIVEKTEDNWVWVKIFDIFNHEPIPFRERELVKTD